MSCNCNCLKTPNRKSALRLSSTTPQTINTTPAAVAGAVAIVDTGCSLEAMSSGARVQSAGLYDSDASVQVDATVAGTVSVQYYLDGMALADTLRTVTVPVGLSVIPVERLFCLGGNCCGHTVQIYVSGTATGTVTAWSMDIVREA